MIGSLAKSMTHSGESLFRANQAVLEIPFDVVRANYMSAVKIGIIERYMLASMRFERSLRALEKLILGPMTRGI